MAALAFLEHRGAGDVDIEFGRADDQVDQDRIGRGSQIRFQNPVHAVACARPCSKPTQIGLRNSGMRQRHDVNAVARAIQTSAARDSGVRTRAS